jgi:cell division septation protein DedD
MRGAALSIALMLIAVAGCTPEQRDWRVAQGADTLDSYEQFVAEHPDSALAREARERIAQLAEDRDWQRAASADNERAYHEYLAQHPNGKSAQQARIRIDSFALAASTGPAKDTTPAKDTPPANDRTLAKDTVPASRMDAPSGTAPAAQVTAAQVAPDYAIQLGAFTSEAKAREQWQLALTSHGAQLAGLTARIDPVIAGGAQLYRLQARVGAESRARALCTVLSAHAQPCVVVPPPR